MQYPKEKLTKVLALIIKNHRIKAKKSIYQISAESAVEYSTWRKIEKASSKDINLSSIWKIAEGLDITPEDLIKELRLKLGENFSITDD